MPRPPLPPLLWLPFSKAVLWGFKLLEFLSSGPLDILFTRVLNPDCFFKGYWAFCIRVLLGSGYVAMRVAVSGLWQTAQGSSTRSPLKAKKAGLRIKLEGTTVDDINPSLP